jgi:hypothetical protein
MRQFSKSEGDTCSKKGSFLEICQSKRIKKATTDTRMQRLLKDEKEQRLSILAEMTFWK